MVTEETMGMDGESQVLQEITWIIPPRQQQDVIHIQGKTAKCAPGLKFSDPSGVKAAKCAGWFLSFFKWKQLTTLNTYLDWINSDAAEPKLSHLINTILRLDKSRGGVKVALNEDQRLEFASNLEKTLTESIGCESTPLIDEGMFILRKNGEARTTTQAEVDERIRKIVQTAVLPPMFVSALAMKEMAAQNDLINVESHGENCSVLFNPVFTDPTPQNPALPGSRIHQDYNKLRQDISNVYLEQDVAVGFMRVMLSQSLDEGFHQEDLVEATAMVEANNKRCREIMFNIHMQQTQLNNVTRQVEDKILNDEARMDGLNETISKTNRELTKRTLQLQQKEQELQDAQESRKTEVAKLTEEVQKLEIDYAEFKQENCGKVAAEELHQFEDENFQLQEKLEEQAQKKRTLEQKLKAAKQEADERIQAMTTDNEEVQMKQKALEKTLEWERSKFEATKHEKEVLQQERDELKNKNYQLKLAMQQLNRKALNMDDTRQEIFRVQDSSISIDSWESERDGNFGQKSRETVSTPMINRLLAPSLVQPDIVATTVGSDKATSKTVSSLLPKWTSAENVRNYTQRVKHTWEFVKGDFDESKFCSLVRIGVSAQLGEIIDNYLLRCKDAEEAATVEKLCDDLVEKLDKRPSEYISEFKSIQKQTSESYSSFAHRLQELYKKGTGTTGKMSQGEIRLLVEQFLEGLPHSEALTLKMVATNEEMGDLAKLALRAARCGTPQQ